MLREAVRLKQDGAEFAIDDSWFDKVWLRTPGEAVIAIERLPSNQYSLGRASYDRTDLIDAGDNLKSRVGDFGIPEVGILLWRTKNGSRNVCAIKAFDTLVDIEAYEAMERTQTIRAGK